MHSSYERLGAMTRVYFNGRFLGRPVTGVERFAGEIIRAIDVLCGEGSPLTAGLQFEILRPRGGAPGEGFRHIRERAVGAWHGHFWEQFDLPRHARGGILVNLCNTAPLCGASSLTCVHDANVFLIPESYSWSFRAVYQTMLPWVIRRSRRWITVSAYSARELDRFGVSDRAPSSIVGNGIEHILRLRMQPSRLAGIDLPKPFVLALGSRSRNKNVDLLYAIAPALHEAGVATVVAGGANSRVFAGQELKPHARVLELGRVADEDIAYLYANALCFAFPSFFEGFGIPAVEAMACGCPVIAADSSALPEVLGDAALYCAPTHPQAWRSAILRLAGDAALRAQLAQRGRERAARYSWGAASVELLHLVRALAGADARA